ncbi:MAG: hypothetical protein QM698_14285 [Micropepsaceae bacterium]
MNRRVTFGERLRYLFDKSMAAGTISLTGWLTAATLLVILLATSIINAFSIANTGEDSPDFGEAFWQSLMRTMDPGTMAGDTGWGYRIVALAVTVAGIFIFSALIGILSSGISERLAQLRKGRSRVLETNHTIIYNWSNSIFEIIAQLKIAGASDRRPRVVVLADKDKVEMEDEIAAKLPDLGRLRVICRRGDPTDINDIAIANPEDSRSIVILSPESAEPDAAVVKTILALVHDPQRRERAHRIAAEIRDGRNAAMARVIGGKELQLVLADDLIARIIVNSNRQSGLSAVYSELLDFDGSEIYTTPVGELAGKTFAEAVYSYQASCLIGFCRADGAIALNPSGNPVLEAGIRLILIAEDDTTIRVEPMPKGSIHATDIVTAPPRPKLPERTLILGWNHRGPTVAQELARYVAPGSDLTIAADSPGLDSAVSALEIDPALLNVRYASCVSSDRTVLEELDIPSYDHVMVLSYADDMSSQAADTRTLVTLLHLRQIADAAGKRVSVVSEMADIRNRELAEVTRADDFVVSNRLISLMLAQTSENELLSDIFAELLDERGSEIFVRPLEDYVVTGKPVNFYTVMESASRRNEIAIGYIRGQIGPRRGGKRSGVCINPPKGEHITFAPGDRLIVIAED